MDWGSENSVSAATVGSFVVDVCITLTYVGVWEGFYMGARRFIVGGRQVRVLLEVS